MSQISIVLPAYRNAATLAELHARLVRALEPEGATLELVIVDDACPAGSGEVALRLAAADSRVRVITHDRNQGQRMAVWHGLAAARGDVIVSMDADLQDRPESVPLLLHELRERRLAAVFGDREGEYQGRLRMATSYVFKRLLYQLTGLPPEAGTFVALTREARDRILRIETAAPSLALVLCAAGLPLGSVPVVRETRATGESAYTEWMRIRLACNDLRAVWKLRRKFRTTSGRGRAAPNCEP